MYGEELGKLVSSLGSLPLEYLVLSLYFFLLVGEFCSLWHDCPELSYLQNLFLF